MNGALTFLIKENWCYSSGKSSIGYSRQGGLVFEKRYHLTDERIEMPDEMNFSKERIIIAV